MPARSEKARRGRIDTPLYIGLDTIMGVASGRTAGDPCVDFAAVRLNMLPDRARQARDDVRE